jgi:signal transduction histidine kinase
MIRKKLSHELPRLVCANYILYSLLAMVALVIGIVLLNEFSDRRQFDLISLNQFRKQHSLASLAAQAKNSDRLLELCQQFSREFRGESCAVYGPDGTCLAHNQPEEIGRSRVFVEGHHRRLENVDVVEFRSENSNYVELSGRLGHDLAEVFVVILTGRQPWVSLENMSGLLAFVLPLPIGLLLLGGVVVYRKVQPMGNAYSQLAEFARTPSLPMAEFTKIPFRDAMSVGWNRLQEKINPAEGKIELESRLASVVAMRRRDRVETTVDSLPDGIAETDVDGQITFINNAMTALLGGDEKLDVLGSTLESCLQGLGGVEQCQELFAPGFRSRSVVKEIERQTSLGERVLRVARHPILTTSDDVKAGQAWSIRDVTQQKLADKAKDDFLNSATHELRTPLANIRAYAETLSLDEVIDVEQQKEFCNIINSEATRLSRFIDELLDVSSIEAGSLHIKMQKVEILRLLEDVVAKVQPQMKQKGIQLEVMLGDRLPELPLDKEKFSTCLINLLGNAAKYTPDNGHIQFKAIVNNNQLIITVTDDGIGISEEDQTKIFDKFYRSDNDEVRDQNGTGLGLAFVREVAKLHDAKLSVESNLGEGSTFALTLNISRDRHHV